MRMPASVSNRSRSSCASAPVTDSRAASRDRSSTISSRSVVVRIASRTVVGPLLQAAHGEVARAIHVGDRTEMREQQGGPGRRADPLDARDGELDIELGRRRGRTEDRKVRDVDPKASPVNTTPVEESTSARWCDAWPGVSSARSDRPPMSRSCSIFEHPKAFRRNGFHGSEQRRHACLAVDAGRCCSPVARIREVPRAALVHPDGGVREPGGQARRRRRRDRDGCA